MKILAITPDRKRDYTAELTIEGLRDLGCEIVASDPGNGISIASSEDSILQERNADFVISFFGKVRDNRSPRYHLLKELREKYRHVHVDGSEWTFTGYPEQNQVSESLRVAARRRGNPWINEDMFDNCDAYFKRECYPQDVARGILPLPFSLSRRHMLETKEKDIDVMCVFGHTTTGLRSTAMRVCEKLKKETSYRIVVGSSLGPEEYRDVLSRSRIVIDAWGGGDTCDRFYEAMGAEACCLYQAYNVVVENPFEDNVNAVSYKDESSFEDNLMRLLSSKQESLRIGREGRRHAMQHHTTRHRAEKIIEKAMSIQ
jgi:hypothetical protein